MTAFDYWKKCILNYADFKGRARRKEYWSFVLFAILFNIGAVALDNLLGTDFTFYHPILETEVSLGYGMIYVMFALSMFIPNLAVSVRRLHDVGKSGWWLVATDRIDTSCRAIPAISDDL